MTPLSSEIHHPLEEGQIRLIKPENYDEGNIRYNMITAYIDSCPDYLALSYVCGQSANSEEIMVNGLPFLIKPNLRDGLERLVIIFGIVEKRSLFIWIDAICINQDDSKEKASQIYDMHIIFSRAEEVIVWLGHIPHDVEVFIEVFKCAQLYHTLDIKLPWDWFNQYSRPNYSLETLLFKIAPKRLNDKQKSGIHDMHHILHDVQESSAMSRTQLLATIVLLTQSGLFVKPPQETPGYNPKEGSSDYCRHVCRLLDAHPGMLDHLPPYGHAFWSGFLALPELTWFERIWTYQEIMLARKATIIAGDTWISWNLLNRGVASLLEASAPDQPLSTLIESAQWDSEVSRSRRRISAILWLQFHGTLASSHRLLPIKVFELAGDRKATVIKDHIYGLLGLLHDDFRAAITVDYTLGDGEAFTSALKAILAVHPGQIMGLWRLQFDPALVRPTIKDLPSWCPHFQSKITLETFEAVSHKILSEAVVHEFESRAKYEDVPGLRNIKVRVLELDRVTRCMRRPFPFTLAESTSSDADYDELFEKLVTWALEMQDMFGNKLDGGNYGIEHDSAIVSILRDSVDEPMELFAVASMPMPMAQMQQDRQALVENCLVLAHWHNRYYFETASGRAGYCARQAMIEGLIVMAPGCNILQLLTPDSTEYVACVTVQGLMDDSLLGLVPQLEDQWRMVCLQ